MSRTAILHPDGLYRCPWPGTDPLYVAYHDEEWGVPEYDDRALFEKLVLDGFQAGLSWITILRKRDGVPRGLRRLRSRASSRATEREEVERADAAMPASCATAPRSRPRSTAPRPGCDFEEQAGFARHLWELRRRTADPEPLRRPAGRAGRDDACRARSPKTCRRAASASSGRPSSTPSCRRRAWSTIISSTATATSAAPAAAGASSCRMAMSDATPTAAAPRAWQRMLSGRRLDLLDPSPLDIEIEDIAHGLARVARWNGQTSGAHVFSVAQHSLLVEDIAAACEPDLGRRLAACRPAARRARICDRRHDLAVQGGDRRRLQGFRGAAPRGHPPPLRPAAGSRRSMITAASSRPTASPPSSRRRSSPASRSRRPAHFFGDPRPAGRCPGSRSSAGRGGEGGFSHARFAELTA